MSDTYETHLVDPKTLVPADYNPRKMSDRQRRSLERSLQEFGFVQPVIVNSRNNVVVGGHQRLTAALSLGLAEVPVVYVDLDDSREKALNVALNKISGDWDYDQLVGVLQDIEDAPEFDLTGFDYDEFQAIERELNEQSKAGREGNVPPPPRVAVSCAGEVYRLGEHIVVCGDSTDPVSYSHTEEPARMMFTDPPYNVAYEGGTAEKLKIENDAFADSAAFRQFLVDFLEPALRKNRGVTYLCYADSEAEAVHGAWRQAGLHQSGGTIKHVHDKPKRKATKRERHTEVITWDKDGFALSRSHYQQGHEPILYGWHKGATNKHWCGDRSQSNVWTYPKPARNREHPTMKPVDLVERALRNSSEPGDWVLDPFGGSGTTLVAAENIGRRAYVIELDPRFIDVIIARYLSLPGHGEVARLEEAPKSAPDGWWKTSERPSTEDPAQPAEPSA